MIIANPLYDVVFKYLLEDLEIAKGLLSAILGEQIIYLDVRPQETLAETSRGITVLRFDFNAVIRSENGDFQKVLIELQKAKQPLDIMRFRRYLGDNYSKEDVITDENGTSVTRPIPVITIYFLGFALENVPSAIIKINRVYEDVVTHEVLDIKNRFVELLTHDSYMIQVSRLPRGPRNKLERILRIFSPDFESRQDKRVFNYDGDTSEPLVKKIAERLGRAIASDEVRGIMNVEDELDRVIERETGQLMRKIFEKDSLISEKEEQLTLKDEQLSQLDEKLTLKDEQLSQLDEKLTLKDEQLTLKDEQLTLKDEQLAQLDEKLAIKERLLAEERELSRLKLLELQRQIEEMKKRSGD